MGTKNILYICDYAAKYTGNFIASLSELAKKAGEEYDVYYLFPECAKGSKWLDRLPGERDRLLFCDFGVKSLWTECRKLAGRLGRKETIVHAHFLADLRLAAVKSCFPKCICHYHMTTPRDTTLVKKGKRLVRCMLYRGAVIVGVSEAVTEDVRNYFRTDACECITNAIDFTMLNQCSAETGKEEIRFDRSKFNILIHGTDFLRKGVDLAIQAVRRLNAEGQDDFRLYVTSNRVEETRKLVAEYQGEDGFVTVLTAVENVKDLYDSVDLFISPSREEAFGYAVVEAAYAGCQVAATDIPGQNTMKRIPGILWMDAESVSGLEEAIRTARAKRDGGGLAQEKEAQREAAQKAFEIRVWVEKNLAVYRKYFGK